MKSPVAPVISESLIWATLLQVGSREENGNAGHDYKRGEDFISSNFWCSRNEYLGVGKVLQAGPPTMLVVQKRWALMKLLPKARSSAELDGSQVIEGNFLFSGIWWCLWWAKTQDFVETKDFTLSRPAHFKLIRAITSLWIDEATFINLSSDIQLFALPTTWPIMTHSKYYFLILNEYWILTFVQSFKSCPSLPYQLPILLWHTYTTLTYPSYFDIPLLLWHTYTNLTYHDYFDIQLLLWHTTTTLTCVLIVLLWHSYTTLTLKVCSKWL